MKVRSALSDSYLFATTYSRSVDSKMLRLALARKWPLRSLNNIYSLHAGPLTYLTSLCSLSPVSEHRITLLILVTKLQCLLSLLGNYILPTPRSWVDAINHRILWLESFLITRIENPNRFKQYPKLNRIIEHLGSGNYWLPTFADDNDLVRMASIPEPGACANSLCYWTMDLDWNSLMQV